MKFSLKTSLLLLCVLPAIGSCLYWWVRPAPQAIFVIANDIPRFGRLNDENISIERWPSDTVPDDAITDPKKIIGKYAALNLSKGMPLTASSCKDWSAIESEVLGLPPDKVNIVTVTLPFAELGGFIAAGDLIEIYYLEEEAKQIVIPKAKVLRSYKFDRNKHRASFILGVGMNDTQTHEYLKAKQQHELKVLLRGE